MLLELNVKKLRLIIYLKCPRPLKEFRGGADLQEKTVFSSIVDQVVEPDENYDGLGKVTIKAYKDASETDVLSSEVLVGKKFVNKDGLGTGTMTNNGAVSAILGKGVTKYTVPKGYHNGSGTVTYNMAVPTLNSSYPQDKTVSYNGSATFAIQISADGEPAVYTYQWYKNSVAISGATNPTVTLSNQTTVGASSIYCKVTNDAGSVTSRVATLTVGDYKPTYSYSGSSSLLDDGNGNWRIKFLTSGTLNVSSIASSAIDVFCVGGGGGGAGFYDNGYWAGGGGGYTTTGTSEIAIKTNYTVTIGAGGVGGRWSQVAATNGGNTSAFGISAAGGGYGQRGGAAKDGKGGNGGSGGGGSNGNGGSNGSNGYAGIGRAGNGQGTTTCEFGETSGQLYAGGGAGGDGYKGGAGGGGNSGYSGAVNTGGGGGSGDYTNGQRQDCAGGSGIVVIRNHR